MDDGGTAGPGKVGLAAGRSDNGGDKIHGSKDGFLTDDVAVVIPKKIAANENILDLRIGYGDIDSADRLRFCMRTCNAGDTNAKLCAGFLSCADCHLGGDRTGINSVILDGVRFDRDKVRFGSGRVSDKTVLHNAGCAGDAGKRGREEAGGAAFGSTDVKRFGFEQLNKLLGGLRDRIHKQRSFEWEDVRQGFATLVFIFLIGQNEEQPGKKDLTGMKELVGGKRDRTFVCFLVVNNSMKTGISKNGGTEIGNCMGVIRNEQRVNQKRDRNAG